MRIHNRFVTALAALVLIASALTSAAQSSLTATDGAAFLGTWLLGLETPQGAMTMTLILKDEAGKVTGSMSADLLPDPMKISEISKDGTKLVLKYSLDVQGQSIPAQTTLIPDGDKWKASFDFADGQFVVDGTAAKK